MSASPLDVAWGFQGTDVAQALTPILHERGRRRFIQCDNGPELAKGAAEGARLAEPNDRVDPLGAAVSGGIVDPQNVACSEAYRELIDPVVRELNQRGTAMRAHYLTDDDLSTFAVGGDFGIVIPRTELAMQRVEDAWEERRGALEHPLFARSISFGVTPIVFFVNPDFLECLRGNYERVGWDSLSDLISRDVPVRIRHASPRHVDGTVVAVAQWLALRSDKKSETPCDATLVAFEHIEKCVDEYGPDDVSVVSRTLSEHTWSADVVIAQESAILSALREIPEAAGTIVYPSDGTLLLSASAAHVAGWERAAEAFTQLSHRLANSGSAELSRVGLHQYTASIVQPSAVADFASMQTRSIQSGVRWLVQSGTATTVLPSRSAVRGIRSLATSAKRALDVCLLFDASGSMGEDAKTSYAEAGIHRFVASLDAPGSRVALITFRDAAELVRPLRSPPRIDYAPGALEPGGYTALFDAVELAVRTLEASGDPSHRWAIVGFTDGMENSSIATLAAVEALLRANPHIKFYAIAFGQDADVVALKALADASGGLMVRSGRSEIDVLFERLSTYGS